MGQARVLAVASVPNGTARNVALELLGVRSREVAGRASRQGTGEGPQGRQSDNTSEGRAEHLRMGRVGQACVWG